MNSLVDEMRKAQNAHLRAKHFHDNPEEATEDGQYLDEEELSEMDVYNYLSEQFTEFKTHFTAWARTHIWRVPDDDQTPKYQTFESLFALFEPKPGEKRSNSTDRGLSIVEKEELFRRKELIVAELLKYPQMSSVLKQMANLEHFKRQRSVRLHLWVVGLVLLCVLTPYCVGR